MPRFFDQPGGVATALHHKTGDHAVEQGVLVIALAHVVEEVLHGDGGLGGVEFQGNAAQAGVKGNLGLGHLESGGVDGLAIEVLNGQGHIAYGFDAAVEDQQLGGAGGREAGRGAATCGVYTQVSAQVFATQVDGGGVAVAQNFGLDGCDGGEEPSLPAAGAEQKQQAEREAFEKFVHGECGDAVGEHEFRF